MLYNVQIEIPGIAKHHLYSSVEKNEFILTAQYAVLSPSSN